jgi:hypothetical protein
MALLTAQSISEVAIALLARRLVLPMTVVRVPGDDFAGDNGDTVTVKVPQPGTSRTQGTRSATITYDDINEVGVNVVLSHEYHAKLISDAELSLDIKDYARQILRVQIDAVARGAENILAAALNGLDADLSLATSTSDADTQNIIIAASEALDEAEVPPDDRYLAVSSSVKSRLIKLLDDDNVAGDPSALRSAIIGNLYGFTVVHSSALAAGEATAYHSTGFAFANRTPVAPSGATDSSTATVDGVGLRTIMQYVPDKLSDASVVSTFAGASVVDTNRVVKIDTTA